MRDLRRVAEYHSTTGLFGKVATIIFDGEFNFRRTFIGRFPRHSSPEALRFCRLDISQADVEHRETTCWHRAGRHWQALRASCAQAKFDSVLVERAPGDAIGVEADQFSRDPHTRIQHIPQEPYWMKVPEARNRFVLSLERACPGHFVAISSH